MGQLTLPLFVAGSGAVTAAGLTAAQTCAAIRAGLAGFAAETLSDPFGAEQVVARIPSNWRLRRDSAQWIVNLAVRAIREAFADAPDQIPPARTALFLSPPESRRRHPAYDHIAPQDLLGRVISNSDLAFHSASRAFDGGAAAALGTLVQAAALMGGGAVDQVILAGVDSLLNPVDLAQLAAAGRLSGGGNSQGLVPGEGAAAVVLTSRPPDASQRPTCVVLALGSAREENTVLSESFSQGRAMLAALREASGMGEAEPSVDFVLSNANGERYAAWESMITRARFYRTRRDRTPAAMAAMSTGEIGSAATPLCLVVARDAFAQGYAPGRMAMAEIASDDGLRTAALLRSTAPAAAQLQAG